MRLRDRPNFPLGTVSFIMDKDGHQEEMQLDIPNPKFYFTEMTFLKEAY
ncbi:MAG: hypothetical protein U9N85_03500 [Bacteroidota bacterium]|nr:hypothetical protein [Bacteroidota bacterium]